MRSIVYHQFRKELHIIKTLVLYIIKPTEIHTWRCDEIQQRQAVVDDIHADAWWYAKPVGLDKKTLVQENECFLELLTRVELVTSSLPRMRSTSWAIAAFIRDFVIIHNIVNNVKY